MFFISITEVVPEYLSYYRCLVFELSEVKILSRNIVARFSPDRRKTDKFATNHAHLAWSMNETFVYKTSFLYENGRFNCYFHAVFTI